MGLTFNLGRVSPSVFTDSSLNVGIGAAPSGTYKLEVTGTAKVSSTLLVSGALTGSAVATFTAAANPLILKSTSATTGYTEYYYNTSTLAGVIGNGGGILTGANNSDFIVRSEADFVVATGGNNRRMTLTSGGNVLIGTTSDGGYKLKVNGEVYSSGSGAALFVQSRDLVVNFAFFASSDTALNFYSTNGGTVGNFNRTTGIYTATSDINKKKDFEESKIGLDAILGLKPTLFRMKLDDNNSPKQLGFIAQEVKEFIPQAYVESDEMIGLSDRPIIAALVKAIQEQQATITSLQDRLDKLENK